MTPISVLCCAIKSFETESVISFTVATSMATRLKNYSGIPIKICFNRYGNVSSKGHERSHRAGGAVPAEYNLTRTSLLSIRYVVMKSKANQRLISRLLCTCRMNSHIVMVGEDEGLLNHDEADVLMISYKIEAVRTGKRVILWVIKVFNSSECTHCVLAFQKEKAHSKLQQGDFT